MAMWVVKGWTVEQVEIVGMPSWLEELVVSTYVPSYKAPTELLTKLVGSEAVAYSESAGP